MLQSNVLFRYQDGRKGSCRTAFSDAVYSETSGEVPFASKVACRQQDCRDALVARVSCHENGLVGEILTLSTIRRGACRGMAVVHLSTIISRSSSAILSHISHLAGSFRNHPLLFTLSHNAATPADDLSSLVAQLTAFSTQSVGCLSAPLPGPHSSFTACSLAVFDPLSVAAVFRSTIPGRQQAQVGRWRPVGQKPAEHGEALQFGGWQGGGVKDWEDVWNASVHTQRLPDELEGSKSVISSREQESYRTTALQRYLIHHISDGPCA